ncbi:MAG: hypothetical protein FJ290_12215 [Planctomycetes bacterium]|nr:hypothetical protein [Planctomycetota bacterium]
MAKKRACALGLAMAMATVASAYVAIVNRTDYQEMHIVPAPGKVVIDGDLKDWDLSGAITLYLDEASRSVMNIQGAYMYDGEAFYVGGHVKDPTPMVNAHDFASDMSLVWDADAVQLRLISNPAVKSKSSLQTGGHMSPEDQRYVCHFDLWYSTRDQKPGFLIRYTLHFRDANLNPPEVQAAYKKDTDGKGYTFEYRVPWKLLRLDKPWKDGDTVQTQWQVHWGDPRGERVKFTGFNKRGGPTWAFDKIETVATDPDGGALPNSEFTVDDEGRAFTLVSGGSLQRGQRPQGCGHRVVGFDAKGRKMWEYHNAHCAFAWTSDAYTPGYMVGAFRMMCTTTKRLIGIPGYYGQYFLLDKETGLFVAALGQDQRSPYTMDHTMVLTENFNGTMWTHPKTGKTYFAGGDADCRIWELKGFEDYRVREGRVKVSAAQFAQAQKNADQAKLAERAAMGLLREFRLKKLANSAANGDYSEWTVVQPQTIVMSDKRSALAQLGYDDAHLWVRFQVADESPLRNQASDYRHLFKTGDALDIQFCTDTATRPVHGQNQQEMRVGDARILVTRAHDDKMIDSIIRYRTATKDKPKQHEYSSAVWKETVDEVSELNGLPMHCKAEKDSYVVEVGVPWSVIGLKPIAGLKSTGESQALSRMRICSVPTREP